MIRYDFFVESHLWECFQEALNETEARNQTSEAHKYVISLLKLGCVMLLRNTFCYTGWNGPAILRVVNALCIQKKERK